MRAGQVVTFDGHRLNDLFRVGVVDIAPPTFEPDLLSKPRGATVRGRRVGTASISIPLVARHGLLVDTRKSIGVLLSWLDVDGARPLSFAVDGGKSRLVVPTGVTIDDAEWEDVLTVTFEQIDPYLFGETRHATIGSGSTSVTFTVDGTAPTRPTIACDGIASTSNVGWLWKLVDESGTYMAVKVDGTYRAVAIDCDSRNVTVGGVTTTITLDSDWLELAPGQHTIRLAAGSSNGAIDITWTERWHR